MTVRRLWAGRAGLADHRPVVRRPERLGGDQRADPRLVEHVGQLVRPVRRVDRDQDGPDPRGRVLHEHPLRPVRRPDPDPVTRAHAQPEQRPGQRVHLVVELPVRPPAAAGHVDQRLPVTRPAGGTAQASPDGLADQRLGGDAAGVGNGCHAARLRRAAWPALARTLPEPCRAGQRLVSAGQQQVSRARRARPRSRSPGTSGPRPPARRSPARGAAGRPRPGGGPAPARTGPPRPAHAPHPRRSRPGWPASARAGAAIPPDPARRTTSTARPSRSAPPPCRCSCQARRRPPAPRPAPPWRPGSRPRGARPFRGTPGPRPVRFYDYGS